MSQNQDQNQGQNQDKTTKDQMGRVVGQGDSAQPSVILVRPQLGENIGGAVRAMLNFGLSELRLVAPRDGWPNPAADAMAAGALPVLEQAKVFATTEAAVADLKFVAAATARRRDLEIPVAGTNTIGAKLRGNIKKGFKCGVMFGPEKAGLTNDDVVLADQILTYPVNPAFQSLNLAQAVGVFSYIWAASKIDGGRRSHTACVRLSQKPSPQAVKTWCICLSILKRNFLRQVISIHSQKCP